MPHPEFAAVPAALRERAQWLLWRFEQKPGVPKPAKMPYYASGKRRAGVQGSDADRAALVTFDVALARMTEAKADGIGFAFLPGSGLIGIDLDKVVDAETGEVSPRAQRIIEACASYAEWSPSGTGFHIYVFGETTNAKDNGVGIEVFCTSQFFTVTGRHLAGTPPEVTQIDDKVLRRLHKTISEAKGGFSNKPAPAPKAAPLTSHSNERERILSALDALDPGLGYDEWVQVGMALHSGLGNDGFSVWDGWSARSDKYPGQQVISSHWKSFKPGRTGVGTLFHLAKSYGWKPPRRAPGSRSIPLPPASAREEKKVPDRAWWFGLWRNDAGNVRPIRENVEHLLTEHPSLRDVVGYNMFAHRIEKRCSPPWGGDPGEWKTQDTRELTSWLTREVCLVGLKLKDVADAVALVGWRNLMNPVRELFESLPPWDGIDRLDYWMIGCLGAMDTRYTRLVGRKFVMGIVKRVLDPGCKFDYMLILEGEQGRGKSSTFRVLAWRDEWFNDTPFSANLDKDARLALHGSLIYEISEMHGFNKADANAVKVFVSQMDDKLRAPYAEQHEVFKRSMVFGGTTNETEYFRDRTGNRRFWPVAITLLLLEKLKEWREQLFAEAIHRLKEGEAVFPSREEEAELCKPEQEKRLIRDPWADFVTAWLAVPANSSRTFLTYVDVFHILKVEPSRITPFGDEGNRIRRVMQSLGWISDRDRVDGVQQRGFRKPTLDSEPARREVEDDDLPI